MSAPHPEAALSAREAEKIAAVKAAILPELSITEAVMASPQRLDDLKAARIARVAVAALDRLSTAHTATAGDGGELVRHVKRGTEYEVVHRGVELQVATHKRLLDDWALALVEGDKLVVYQGADGKLWAREEAEFRDGRFETIADSPTPTDAQPKAARLVGDEALAPALAYPKLCFTYCGDGICTCQDRPLSSDEITALGQFPASHPTTGQETVATPRDGGVREAPEVQEFTVTGDDGYIIHFAGSQYFCFQHEVSAYKSWATSEIARLRAALSAPGSAGPGETLAWADQEPDLGARTREPSIRQIVHAYYAPHFDTEKTDDLTERYLAALATPSPAQEPGTGDTGEPQLPPELFKAAKELAGLASYAEIVRGVSVNGMEIRKACDEVFRITGEHQKRLDAEEDRRWRLDRATPATTAETAKGDRA